MAIEDLFQETCTIQEVARAADGKGGVENTWSPYIEDVPCRLQALSAREVDEYAKREVSANFRLFILPQEDNIKEGEHRVKFNDGVEDRYFDIVHVDKWNFDEHHWKLVLWEQK